MRTVGRALREFVRADDELFRREWAETVVATALDALDDLEGDIVPAPDNKTRRLTAGAER